MMPSTIVGGYKKKKKREMRNTYEPYQQTTTTEHQIHDLGQVQIIAAGLNVFIVPNLHPSQKQ